MKTGKDIAMTASGLLGFVLPTLFAWKIFAEHIHQNMASWCMIFVLDVLGVLIAYQEGNKKPYFQLGWTGSVLCIIFAVWINQDPWHWGWIENISLCLCCITLITWKTKGVHLATWVYIIAMYMVLIPVFWQLEQGIWILIWSIETCLLAIYGAPKRDFANTSIPISMLILNIILIPISLL